MKFYTIKLSAKMRRDRKTVETYEKTVRAENAYEAFAFGLTGEILNWSNQPGRTVIKIEVS